MSPKKSIANFAMALPRKALALVLAGLSLAMLPAPAAAAIVFALGTGNTATNTQKLLIDSNNCAETGMRAAFVGGRITNTGAAAVTEITATMTGLNANINLTGGQPATQTLGALGPGESVGVYWYVGYNCTVGATATPLVTFASSLGSQSSTVNLQTSSAIKASAGGLVTSNTLGPGAVVGQTITLDTTYSFGGASTNDEYFLQPAGNQSFNAACFRLVGSQITASIVTAIPVGSANRLYFLATASQGGTGKTVSVRYFFQYLCANQATVADSYAAQTSGSSNIKYTGNYGSTPMDFTGAANPFTISKTVSPVSGVVGQATGPLTYTVTISNPSAYTTIIDRVVDQLPTGMTYIGIAAGSDVTAANSGSLPASGAGGPLTFQGKLGTSYALPAGGSLRLIYTASAPTTSGTYTNTAQAFIGMVSTPTAAANFTMTPPVNPVTDSGSVSAGFAATAIANVRANDTINGQTATSDNSTIAVSGTWPAGIALDPVTGAITVAATVPAGTYSLTYQLCNLATPTPLCQTVADTVDVVVASADLGLSKSNGTTSVMSGGSTTYTLTVTNHGPATVSGATVTDSPGTGISCPAGNAVTITGNGVPSGSFTVSNLIGPGIVLGTLTAGQATVLSYTCQVS